MANNLKLNRVENNPINIDLQLNPIAGPILSDRISDLSFWVSLVFVVVDTAALNFKRNPFSNEYKIPIGYLLTPFSKLYSTPIKQAPSTRLRWCLNSLRSKQRLIVSENL